MKLLHIDSSIMRDKSVSRDLSADIVDHFKTLKPGIEVKHYDLDAAPVSYLSSTALTDENEQAESEKIINEFIASDILVIGAPMYNFGIPAQLKAWIDRIVVAGKTFRYTADGSEGLVTNKKIIIASSRGGVYSGELSFLDHQESYLKGIFVFLGLSESDIEIIRAEGVNLSPDTTSKAVANAKLSIPSLKLSERA